MRLTGRVGLTAAAALVGPLLFAPAAHAAGSYDCFNGSRAPSQEGYNINAGGCDGFGYADVVVTVFSGSAKGTHRCRTAFSWNGSLAANFCHEENP